MRGASRRWVAKRNARRIRKMGAQTQCKACPQDGCPNATQGTSASQAPQGTQGTPASWAPKRNTRHVRKLGAPTQRNARLQVGCPNARPQRKARLHVRNARQGTSATQGTSASWAAQRTSASWAAQRTSAIWAPQRNARHVRRMVAQTQNSSATKTSTQGSTRLKDELEDG